MREELIRQYDIIPEGILSTPITIIGAGAVGSFTALSLAKMGFTNITVFDPDTVGVENLNAQFYGRQDVGELKVVALGKWVEGMVGIKIKTHAKKYIGERVFKGVVISAVDTMAAREVIWNAHKNSLITKLFIDPRMGAEYLRIFTVQPDAIIDRRMYEKTLHSDSESVEEPCTAKSTIYTVLLISGLICKIVKDKLCAHGYYRIVEWDVAANRMKGYQ